MATKNNTSTTQTSVPTQDANTSAGVAVLEFKECNEWEGERWRTGYLVTEDNQSMAESIQNTIDEVNALYRKAWDRDSAYSVMVVAPEGRSPEQYLRDRDEAFEDEGCYKPAYTIGSDLRNLYNETEKFVRRSGAIIFRRLRVFRMIYRKLLITDCISIMIGIIRK